MRRRPGVVALVLVLLALVVVTVLAVPVPRPAPPVVTGVMPGSFTGYAFDTCEAPSQRQMDAWHEHFAVRGGGHLHRRGEPRAAPASVTWTLHGSPPRRPGAGGCCR